MIETATTLAIGILFVFVFVASLVDYARRRDPLSREGMCTMPTTASADDAAGHASQDASVASHCYY